MPKISLDKRQKYARRVLSRNDGGAVWHRVGEGKTRVAYAWFATIAKSLENPGPVFLVVCRRKTFYDWQEEARKCHLDWDVVDFEIFLGKLYGRKRPLVLLVSHGMLHKLREEVADIGSVFEAVSYDEGFLYKNPQALLTKAANKISEQVCRASVLSGSVMTNRNLENVFGQFYAINMHERVGLGRTLTDFRSRFMVKLEINPHRPEQFKFVNARRAVEKVSELVGPYASVWFPKSPRKIRHIVRTIPASSAQRRAIRNLRDEYYLQTRKGVLELKNAPTLITKCQQISDGYLRVPEGEVRYGSEKLSYLLELIAELVSCGERVVVWCAFQRTVEIVLQQLQKHLPSIKAYGFTGKRALDIAGWTRNGQVAVGTEDSGSGFNHFAGVAHAIYYSMSNKWLSLQQSRGRTDRKSSKHPVAYYYYLFTDGSLDASVRKVAEQSGREEANLIALTEVNKWLQEP